MIGDRAAIQPLTTAATRITSCSPGLVDYSQHNDSHKSAPWPWARGHRRNVSPRGETLPYEFAEKRSETPRSSLSRSDYSLFGLDFADSAV